MLPAAPPPPPTPSHTSRPPVVQRGVVCAAPAVLDAASGTPASAAISVPATTRRAVSFGMNRLISCTPFLVARSHPTGRTSRAGGGRVTVPYLRGEDPVPGAAAIAGGEDRGMPAGVAELGCHPAVVRVGEGEARGHEAVDDAPVPLVAGVSR